MSRKRSPLGPFLSPRPPHGLRGKVLDAAEEAGRRGPNEIPARGARFGPWDWAWAAGLALLLVANVFVGGHARRRALPPAASRQEQAAIAELARLGIVAPELHPAHERPNDRDGMDKLSGAAGADF